MVVRGFGFGASMLPTMTAAYAGMPATALAQATSAFTILQRIGASVGTAVLAVVLQQATGDSRHVADAFGTSFWWALSITALAVIPSAFLTGRNGTRPRRPLLPLRSRGSIPVPGRGKRVRSARSSGTGAGVRRRA